MTYTEAAESIKKYICCEKPIQRHCQDSCLDEIENCPYSLAIEAMEKQIPKKPNDYYKGSADKKCAVCGTLVFERDRYCPRCGQAIDWSE